MNQLCGAPGKRVLAVLAASFLFAPCPLPASNVPPAPRYGAVARELSAFIQEQVKEKNLPAVSIALVDRNRVVWAQGFGHADPARKTAATAATIYRVGSVSKLFTDLAIMQRVERGKLDLDAPISRWLPDFEWKDRRGTTITLRQLMTHRSGLLREPPVGHYFQSEPASLEATARSIAEAPLIYPPGERTKYSNAAIALAGYILERVEGRPFAAVIRESLLQPMGMRSSAFQPQPAWKNRIAKSFFWTYHGRAFAAPRFELGMAPAGSLYSTVTDLGSFLSVLLRGGRGANAPMLAPETLQRMWRVQYGPEGTAQGFGIGFHIGTLDGARVVGHGGAIYGFATELIAMPEEGLGVVAVTTMDSANAVTARIGREALRLMRATRSGTPLPRIARTAPVPADLLGKVGGFYRSEDAFLKLTARRNTLYLLPSGVTRRVILRAAGPGRLVADDLHVFGPEVEVLPEGIRFDGKVYRRDADHKPAPAPASFAQLIGEYGWDYNTLYLLEREGRLYSLIEWFDYSPMQQEGNDLWRFPNSGLYAGESLRVQRGSDGTVTGLSLNGIVFPRRPFHGSPGDTFQIKPLRPVSELRAAARQASPPQEKGQFRPPDLVAAQSVDPNLQLDIRYASTNNFLGTALYSKPAAYLQRPAAEALARAHRKLNQQGYGLLIHDAYRPWYVTRMFWDATPSDMKIFVASPKLGSRHNRGAAVDLALADLLTGEPVAMVSGYDEFSDRAYPEYPGETSLQRWHRELLRAAMEEEGFSVYEVEWWHYDHQDWRKYRILNVDFEEIPD